MDKYQQLEFQQPEFLENPYGIIIYIGTKGKDNWCVEIPNKLTRAEFACFKYDKNFTFYGVTEEFALEIAAKYTELAKKLKSYEKAR